MSALIAHSVSYAVRGISLVDAVDFDAAAGEVTAVIGPNGAGKSTLLAILAGDLRPLSGTVHLRDAEIGTYSAGQLARQRSVLLQQAAVAFSYTVREVVTMGRSAWRGHPSAEDDEMTIDRALTQTDVAHLADRDVTTLSGGEQSRVALARVLAQSAPVVLLDEPTAALDIRHQESTLVLARELAEAGSAVVVVLHDLDAAATHADRVVALAGGRVAASGPVREVMTAEVLSELYGHPIDVFEHPLTGRPLVVPSRGGVTVR